MRGIDLTAAAVLAVAATLLGALTFDMLRLEGALDRSSGLDQRIFGLAMMSACGRGSVIPVLTPPAGGTSPMLEFLTGRQATVACALTPEPTADLQQADDLMRASAYLTALIETTWRSFGPSWTAMAVVLGGLYAAGIVSFYFVCRAAMGVVSSVLAAATLAVSPLQLEQFANIRDFSKAPFFMLTILVCVVVGLRRLSARATLWTAVAIGAALGFGFGIRTDVLVNVIVVAVVFAMAAPTDASNRWRPRAVAPILCLIAFVVVAAPIFKVGVGGGNTSHWTLLGLADAFDGELGVAPARYRLGSQYNDAYVSIVVDAFNIRTHPGAASILGQPEPYARASGSYLSLLARTFPADFAIRGWASVMRVLDLPATAAQTHVPPVPLRASAVRAALGHLVAWRQSVLSRLRGLTIPLFVLTTLVVAAFDMGAAALLFALVAVFGGYPAIQYQSRHVFHLEAIGIFLWALALSAAARMALDRWNRRPAVRGRLRPARAVAFAAAAAAVVLVPVVALRAYQQRTAHALLLGYAQADREIVPLAPVESGHGRVRLGGTAFSASSRDTGGAVASEMLVASIGSPACRSAAVVIDFAYTPKWPTFDFSRRVTVAVPAGAATSTDIYMPIYLTDVGYFEPEMLRFAGVDVSAGDAGCVRGLAKLRHPRSFPLLLEAVLAAGWQTGPLYQRLATTP